jgi:hypothetical protein
VLPKRRRSGGSIAMRWRKGCISLLLFLSPSGWVKFEAEPRPGERERGDVVPVVTVMAGGVGRLESLSFGIGTGLRSGAVTGGLGMPGSQTCLGKRGTSRTEQRSVRVRGRSRGD